MRRAPAMATLLAAAAAVLTSPPSRRSASAFVPELASSRTISVGHGSGSGAGSGAGAGAGALLLLHRGPTSATAGGSGRSARGLAFAPLLRMSSSSSSSASAAAPSGKEEDRATLEAAVKAKGDEIRALKDGGADKAAVAPLVTELLALKARLDPDSVKPQKEEKKKKKTQKGGGGKQQQTQKKTKGGGGGGGGGGNDDAESDYIVPRSENYSRWYSDVIRTAGLAEQSPVRGCMVIRPWGMSLWDSVRTDLDGRIREHGAENAYFPLLIPKSFLSKEAEHVDGFAKECAVVTHHRLMADPDGDEGSGELIVDPDAELEDPLIIRPTSETMIWNMFKKWIVSHR